MHRYILRRLFEAVPVLFGASLIVFLLLQIIPGDIAQVLLGADAPPTAVAALREQLGLNDPIYVQYTRWLGKVVQGDLGISLQSKKPVTEVLGGRFQNTLLLTVAAILFATVIGMAAGIISATRQYSLFDRVAMFVALFGNSMPSFWLGLVLILVFSLGLGWFPTGGMRSVRGDGGVLEVARHMVLPTITLASVTTALVARMVRSSMLEVIRQDYIMTARAKGQLERVVVLRHALRNALLPTVTVIGLQFGYLLGGAVLTETVFNWPGIGLEIYKGITTRDVPLLQGAILLTSATFVMMNLAVDVLYAYLDPRIRYA